MPLRDKPIEIDDDNWYYEERQGVCVVHRVKDHDDQYLKTDQFYIPWKRLLESVKRKFNLKP